MFSKSSMNSHSLKLCTHIYECVQNKSKQHGNDSCNKLQLKVLLKCLGTGQTQESSTARAEETAR